MRSFSLTAAGRATEAEPAARETVQVALSEQEASIHDAAAGIARSARKLAAIREPVLSAEIPTGTPSSLLGAPSLPSRTSETRASQPNVDPALFSKGLAAALAPRNDNLAFSIKMLESNSAARRAQQAAQPEPTARNQAGTQTKTEEHTPEPPLASSAIRATSPPAAIPGEVAAAATTVSPLWNEAAATPQLDVRPDTQFSEPHEPANISTVAALHDAQPVLPEAPRPNVTGEILLQLGGKDQTSAAIRVIDRAGTVNVSVHASDADLRSSLRSNLGELASQLSHQGWKTEVVKTGTTLTRGDTPRDSRQDGQRSPGQQQPSPQGERQPQRDRRAASGQWRTEFEDQAFGNSGNLGGTN